MSLQTLSFRGQPAVRLDLAGGDSCTVALHGAQLLSWICAGTERLYLSPEAIFDGKAAIRGGVPVCWPQFNQRGPLPKHGFARNLPWTVDAAEGTSDSLSLSLRPSEASRAIWPEQFLARLRITLAPNRLRVALEVDNTGTTPWSFTAALHSYLRVDDVTQVRLEGLQGARRWDSLRDAHSVEEAAAPVFGAEFDSVYGAPGRPLRLVQPAGTLEITQSPQCAETVVWNPGPVLGGKLGDMPADGWRQMLCVEAAQIDQAVQLAPGASWQGWQQLAVI
jgi:glucose-6-phosphate 1-epimerase